MTDKSPEAVDRIPPLAKLHLFGELLAQHASVNLPGSPPP